MIVIVVVAASGLIIGMLSGFEIPKIGCFKGLKVKPICTKVNIPPVVVMIAMGCIARNFFGSS